MTDLIIVGAGGLGRELSAFVGELPNVPRVAGFVDDDEKLHDTRLQGKPVLGNVELLKQERGQAYVIAIGNPRIRRRLALRIGYPPYPGPIHPPDMPTHASNTFESGIVLCRGVTPTVNVTIGRHVFVNLHCTIGHDAVLGDFTVLHPGVHVSGEVHIGEAVEIGTGAVVLPGVRVGDEARIGAGAVVTTDVAPGRTVVGVPAEPVR